MPPRRLGRRRSVGTPVTMGTRSHRSSPARRATTVIGAAVLLLVPLVLLGRPATATDPEEIRLTLEPVAGEQRYTFTGVVPPGGEGYKYLVDGSPCAAAEPVDDVLDVEVAWGAARLYRQASVQMTFTVTWPVTGDDLLADLEMALYGPSGTQIAYSNESSPPERILVDNPDEGPYRLAVCGATNAQNTEFEGVLHVETKERGGGPPSVTTGATPPSAGGSQVAAPPANVRTGGRGALASPAALPVQRPAHTNIAAEAPVPIPPAPSAYLGGAAETGDVAPPRTITRTDDAARVPWWVVLALTAAGIVGLVVALIVRRRRGYDQPQSSMALVPQT